MTDSPRQGELLEVYKLHAELADRVSQRREGANQRYITILTAMATVLVMSSRLGTGSLPSDVVLSLVAFFGATLSLSWVVVIRSYRQLNSGKFKALRDLETRIAYQFFQVEWDALGKGRDQTRYWKLTIVESWLPWIFFVLFIAVALLSFVPFAVVDCTCVRQALHSTGGALWPSGQAQT